MFGFFRLLKKSLEVEAFFALFLDLLEDLVLCEVLGFERVAGCQHEVETHPCGPDIDLIATAIFQKKLRGQILGHPDNIKVPFAPPYNLGQPEICQIQFLFLEPDGL